MIDAKLQKSLAPADWGGVERCACGGKIPAGATFCPLCHRNLRVPHSAGAPWEVPPDVRPDQFAPAAAGDLGSVGRTSATTVVAPVRKRYSRWAHSEVTFGPVGRVVMSVLITLPLLFFLESIVGFGGLGGLIYLPLWLKGLKEIWARASVVVPEGSAGG